jgi:hypothetical protein
MRLQQRQRSTRASTADSIRSRPDSLSLTLGKGVELLTLSSSSQCEPGKNESKQIENYEIANTKLALSRCFGNFSSLYGCDININVLMVHSSDEACAL